MFEIELFICIKMDLALNNLQRLICHKTQTNKHVHYLLGVGEKVWESSKKKPLILVKICGKQETSTSDVLSTDDQWVHSAVVIVLLHSQH